ncbi:titin-like [Gambusia affinis]|uniref:titin-like n=1 Tax=Gambusia affinis TaxID=33528 RepID=UPI001CDB4AF9|nr:titin-like [Gambusia affinis]
MKTSVLFFILPGIIIGLIDGSGVLPDGPLNASVGGTVTFTTNLNPTETPFVFVNWQFDPDFRPDHIIISLTTGDTTAPGYEGRITLFRSTGSLELRNLELSDSGDYIVSIQDGINQKIGRTKLNVYEPVSIVRVPPLSADLIEFNSSVSLFCSSSGSSLSFLWMKDNSQVTASDRVQISTNEENSTLTIVNVTRNDQGSFTCHVSNPASSIISDPVNISVSYGPDNVQIEVYPSQEHHEIGSTINLTCSADSSPSAEYQWFLNGDKLTSSGPLLRLMNIQMSQSGNYSCQVFNSKTLRYQTSQPSPISVHERVSNVKVTQDVTHLIEFSGSVSFSCSSSGSSLSFLWMNSSSEVSVSDRVQITNITDGGSKLNIINVTRYDDGSYSCKVSNPVSNDSSDPANVSVSYGPEKINLKLQSQKYPEGSNIHLSCSADSRPNATFEWFFNGNLSGSGSELQLINVQKDQSGNYSCRAFNNITSRYQTSQVSAISIVDASKPGGLAGGAIAGIIIACLLVVAAGAAGGYFIYKRRENVKPASHLGTTEQQHDYENMPRIKKSKEEGHVYENFAATQRSKEPEHVYEEMAQPCYDSTYALSNLSHIQSASQLPPVRLQALSCSPQFSSLAHLPIILALFQNQMQGVSLTCRLRSCVLCHPPGSPFRLTVVSCYGSLVLSTCSQALVVSTIRRGSIDARRLFLLVPSWTRSVARSSLPVHLQEKTEIRSLRSPPRSSARSWLFSLINRELRYAHRASSSWWRHPTGSALCHVVCVKNRRRNFCRPFKASPQLPSFSSVAGPPQPSSLTSDRISQPYSKLKVPFLQVSISSYMVVERFAISNISFCLGDPAGPSVLSPRLDSSHSILHRSPSVYQTAGPANAPRLTSLARLQATTGAYQFGRLQALPTPINPALTGAYQSGRLQAPTDAYQSRLAAGLNYAYQSRPDRRLSVAPCCRPTSPISLVRLQALTAPISSAGCRLTDTYQSSRQTAGQSGLGPAPSFGGKTIRARRADRLLTAILGSSLLRVRRQKNSDRQPKSQQKDRRTDLSRAGLSEEDDKFTDFLSALIEEPVQVVGVIPQRVDINEFNGSLHLHCSFIGNATKIQWLKGSSDFIQISGAEPNLTIPNVTRADHGSYRCNVSNSVSFDISEPAEVFINYGPEDIELKVSPSGPHHEGSNVLLTCSVQSRPSPEFLWFLNEDRLSNTKPDLRLSNIQTNQDGNYSCQAFNRRTLKTQTSQPLLVPVIERVSSVVVASDATDLVEFNSSVRLSCSASGFSPHYFWMNNGSEVTSSDRVQITDGGSTLTIAKVARPDLNLLRCHAFNYFSEEFSDPVNISIFYGPELVELTVVPSQEHYKEGSDVTLSCSAVSNPPAEFQWLINENLLPHSGPELRLINVEANQTGNYSCQAFNKETLVYQTSQLSVISVVVDYVESGGLSAGAIAGIVIACLVAVAVAIVAGIYFLYRRKKNVKPKPKNDKKPEPSNQQGEHPYQMDVTDLRPEPRNWQAERSNQMAVTDTRPEPSNRWGGHSHQPGYPNRRIMKQHNQLEEGE